MDMVSLHSKEDYESLKPDAWGIPTPSVNTIEGRKRCLHEFDPKGTRENAWAGSHLDLIIMPGVAFDTRLRRLGHGKGFYDLFLRRYKENGASIGMNTHMPFLGKPHQLSYCAQQVLNKLCT